MGKVMGMAERKVSIDETVVLEHLNVAETWWSCA
jgi:hypothetical protein